jgi:hypothetical protein
MASKKKSTTADIPKDSKKAEDEKLFKTWNEKVARAREVRKKWETDYRVEEGERAFLGQRGDDHKNAINHLAATIKTQRPGLFFSMPKFYVRPRPGKNEPVSDRKAAVGEGVLETIAQQDDNLEKAGGRAVLQAFFRIGVLKTIYDPRMEPNPSAGEPLYEMAGGKPVMDEAGEAKFLKNPLTGEVETEPEEVLTDEVYRFRWVDAANMLLPDEGPDSDAWTWIGEEIVVPLEDAKADTRFPKGLREKLTANKTRSGRNERDAKKRREDDEEMFEYVECYDLRKKRLRVIAEGQDLDGFLADTLIPAWIDNDPYAILSLGEEILGPEPCPWPVPVVKDWLPIQDEYNIRRGQITQGAKRSARKVIYFEGTFSDEEEARKVLTSPIDMEAAKATAPNLVPIMLGDSDLNPAIWKDIPHLVRDWQVTTGTTGARQADPDSDTATEASFVERAANLRDSDGQKLIVRWMSVAGRKMFQCIKKTLTLDMWIQMREMDDKDIIDFVEGVMKVPREALTILPGLKASVKSRLGQLKWQSVTREDLIFEADVTVVPGSTRPKNLDVERRQWMEFLRVLGQAPQLALSRELLRYTAERFDIHDDRLLDELTALAQQMISVNANQAGRSGAGGAGGANGAGSPDVAALLAGATGGAR